jgi:cell shape-determining protein MreC
MRLRQYRPSKRTVFVGLMVLSAIAVFLPPWITDASKHGTQLLVPLQDAAYFATHWAAKSVADLGQANANQTPNEAMMNELASQAGMIEQLREENQRLGGLRKKAIPFALQVQVVARDIAAWRDSLLVERGSELGVHRQDWAASRLFINQGALNQVQEGQAVIAREILLGRVEEVSPYMSRVQLFSDLDSPPIEVRVGAMHDGRFEFVDYPCSLRGQGRGKMVIQAVDYRYIDGQAEASEDDGNRRIKVGDYVCSAPGQLGLPQPMVIGRVVEISRDPQRRLVFDVVVDPAIEIDQIRHVNVIPLIPTEVAIE